jgi:hypothetical protein
MAKLADGADGGRRSDESSELLAKFASKLAIVGGPLGATGRGPDGH